jgi:two-component system OmpR family response regulator
MSRQEQDGPPRRPDGTPAHLLVVDDEEVLLDLLRDALRFAGYEVATAATGFDALREAKRHAVDLVVLDVNLPDLDGFDVCRRLRADGHDTPVVYLTARDAPEDLRTGFTRGGDDYITKPFSLEELDLRIRAILRRRLPAAAGAQPQRLAAGDLVVDDDAHRVWVGGEEVDLSPTEYRLLHYLLLNEGRVLSKAQILERVWQYDFDGDGAVVETYVSYLRRKLDRGGESRIRTVRGVGYSLRIPDESP